jgi:hypothetical protein
MHEYVCYSVSLMKFRLFSQKKKKKLIVLIYFIFKYFYMGLLASTIVDANSLILYIYIYI